MNFFSKVLRTKLQREVEAMANQLYQNSKIDTKVKLSFFWTATMFLFIYADLKALYQTGIIEQIISGSIIGMPINQSFLFTSAILMSIPALMIVISVIFPPNANRILNIIFASLFILVNIGTYFAPGKTWYYYIYFNVIEYIFCILIILHAWKWPKAKAGVQLLQESRSCSQESRDLR